MLTFLKNFIFPTQFTFEYDSGANIIVVPVLLQNYEYELFTTFALDTGASFTVVDESVASFLQLETSKPFEILTASGTTMATKAKVPDLSVGTLSRSNTQVIVSDLPDDAGVTGLLGLSFLKHYICKIDSKNNTITLTSTK